MLDLEVKAIAPKYPSVAPDTGHIALEMANASGKDNDHLLLSLGTSTGARAVHKTQAFILLARQRPR